MWLLPMVLKIKKLVGLSICTASLGEQPPQEFNVWQPERKRGVSAGQV